MTSNICIVSRGLFFFLSLFEGPGVPHAQIRGVEKTEIWASGRTRFSRLSMRDTPHELHPCWVVAVEALLVVRRRRGAIASLSIFVSPSSFS